MTTDNEQPLSQTPQPTAPVYRTRPAAGQPTRSTAYQRRQRITPSSATAGTTATTSGPGPVSDYYRRMQDYYRRSPRFQRVIYQNRFAPAFWTVASVISLVINVILIAILLLLGRQLFNLRTIVSEGVLGGLYTNFVKMDEASILTTVNVNSTIQVQDTIPVVFDLPLNQNTAVILTEPTTINGATIFLNGAAVPLNIILPSGTNLNIGMDMVVPVSTTVPVALNVPVNLTVPVDIPLDQTELHEPFVGLQTVVQPYNTLLAETPSSWEEIAACDHWYSRWLCKFIFGAN
jgi:hypothetical protein